MAVLTFSVSFTRFFSFWVYLLPVLMAIIFFTVIITIILTIIIITRGLAGIIGNSELF